MRIQKYILLVILALLPYFNFSQITLVIKANDDNKLVKGIKPKKTYVSETATKKELSNIINELQSEGYLLANLDSVNSSTNLQTAYISAGNKYKWGELKINQYDKILFADAGLGEKLFRNSTFKPKEYAKIYAKLLNYLENNGYPFASVKLDSLQIENEKISGTLKITKNKLIKLDSLIQEGKTVVSYNFISHYLGIKEGMPYSEKKFVEISNKLRQLPFLIEKKKPLTKVTDKYTKLYLFLDKKNASQFDGIIGLLPSTSGKTVFTGDVKIKLMNNIFKAGELVELNFRRLQSQTQDILIKTNYPYLFKSPVGVDYTLKIYRKDTSFIDVNNNIGLQYLFGGLNNIKVFYKQRTSNLLSTAGLETATTLPDFADISTSSYGIGINLEKLDYRFNPRKGFYINVNGSAGNRKIKKNPRLQEVVYSKIDLFSYQYQSEGTINFYVPIAKKSCIKLGVQGATVLSKQIFRNELLRIGGLKTLRGFDEESIYASSYLIPTLEYRFLFEQNSSIVLFTEAAWYENNSVKNYVTDIPYSAGAGINFETKAGIFSLNYALGSQFGNPFDLRTGKIHFGIVNQF